MLMCSDFKLFSPLYKVFFRVSLETGVASVPPRARVEMLTPSCQYLLSRECRVAPPRYLMRAAKHFQRPHLPLKLGATRQRCVASLASTKQPYLWRLLEQSAGARDA